MWPDKERRAVQLEVPESMEVCGSCRHLGWALMVEDMGTVQCFWG